METQTMTVKEKLYHLVNALPETELVAAERYLEYLAHLADPVALALELAPEDDEPLTEADREALSAREATNPADYIPLDVALSRAERTE